MTVTMHGGQMPPADRSGWRPEPRPAELGPVGLSVHSFPEVPTILTPAPAGCHDPERYRLSLITATALRSGEDGRWPLRGTGVPGRPGVLGEKCVLGETGLLGENRVLGETGVLGQTGVLVLHDSWLPFGSRALPGAGRGDVVMLHFPKAALPLRPPGLERLPACRLSADAGMGAVLARYLTSVASALERGEVGEREGERLGRVALDLTVMTLTPWVGAHGAAAPVSRRQALLARIEAFIEHRLGDPDLTPTAIAAHHHISPGYLHRLFQDRDLTVAAWIRHRRLESCRVDLADPALRPRPVHAIGARWGFRGAAEFSRAFRAAYGMTPGDCRRQALSRE